jgi:hypothetical protein
LPESRFDPLAPAKCDYFSRPGLRPKTPIGFIEAADETYKWALFEDLAGLMIAPDHQQFLAWRAVPTRRIVVRAAVAGVHAFNNGKTYRRAALVDVPEASPPFRSSAI